MRIKLYKELILKINLNLDRISNLESSLPLYTILSIQRKLVSLFVSSHGIGDASVNKNWRLQFIMLYCKERHKNHEYRKESSRRGGIESTYKSSLTTTFLKFGLLLGRKNRKIKKTGLCTPVLFFEKWILIYVRFHPSQQ